MGSYDDIIDIKFAGENDNLMAVASNRYIYIYYGCKSTNAASESLYSHFCATLFPPYSTF